MRGRPIWPLFVGLAAAVVAVDQLVKAWIVGAIEPGERIELVGEYLRLILVQNDGAVFGLFRDNALLFGLLSIVVVGLIVAYHGRSPRSAYLSTTLGLLLGGAIGNLIDRLRLGHVIDFVDAGIGDLRFYTFNVADSAISLSILMLILLAIRPSLADSGRPSAARPQTDRDASPDGDRSPAVPVAPKGDR
jgi:signal peptidase II